MASELSKKPLALVDVNNFYVSCERVFQPRLEKKPVIVLSSENGCVIARSNESKSLGVAMAVPYYKIRDLVREENINVLAANFGLYADMSTRLMELLKKTSPLVETYSVDEAFLDFSHVRNLPRYARALQKRLMQCLGLPVSIGLAANKTLAKAANRLAKKQGIFSFLDLQTGLEHFKLMPASAIWGIGHQTAAKLKQYGILTAYDLKNCRYETIKTRFNIHVAQIVLELNGQRIFPLESENSPKQIMVSRSFGKKIDCIAEIKTALKYHVSSAAEKLRAKNLKTAAVKVFLEGDFLKNEASKASKIEPPNDTGTLIKTAIQLLTALYNPGSSYRKTGIVLQDLKGNSTIQADLFSIIAHKKSEALMGAIDSINHIFGKETIGYSTNTLNSAWRKSIQLRSPAFTTCWEQLLTVHCK